MCCLTLTKPLLAIEPPKATYVTELNDEQFENFIESAEKPVIVDFWAPWCPPCMRMKPIFEEMAQELQEDYLFVSVNFDEGPHVAEKYGVTTIPTFKVIKNNTVIGTFVGSTDKDNLINRIHDAVHQIINQDTLLNAIQAEDKELVAKCLADAGVDVNGITQMHLGEMTFPMTPLFLATSQAIHKGQSSLDIVLMLLKAGAEIDLELDFNSVKGSVRSMVEQMAQLDIEEALSKRSEEDRKLIEDEMLRQGLLNCKARAVSLLELFQDASTQ